MKSAYSREEIVEMSYLDVDGILRWKSNDNVPFREELTAYFGKDVAAIERCCEAREKAVAAFLEKYRRDYTGSSDEARCEARAEFGAGVTLVNVLTGTKWTT